MNALWMREARRAVEADWIRLDEKYGRGALQSKCPTCGESFMYRPNRQEVERREDGEYIHSFCKGK